MCISGVYPILSLDDGSDGDVSVGQLAIKYVVSPKADQVVEVPAAKWIVMGWLSGTQLSSDC